MLNFANLWFFAYFCVFVVVMMDTNQTQHTNNTNFPPKCVRLALSERSERLYASRVSECEHMQICFFERSEKMLGSKFAPIKIHAPKERVIK